MSNSNPAFSPSAANSHLPSSPGCDNKKHVQTLSVVPCCSFTKSCPTLGDPMDCMQHTRLLYLLEFAQIDVTISSSVPLTPSPFVFPFCLQSFPASVSFLELTLHIRCPNYWSFSISPSNEYSGLISFRVDWFDPLAIRGSLKSLLQYHSSKVQPSLWYNSYMRKRKKT